MFEKITEYPDLRKMPYIKQKKKSYFNKDIAHKYKKTPTLNL